MNPREYMRFPFVDVSIVLAMVLIGWAELRLARIEPQFSSAWQQSRELQDVFTDCRNLFKESIASPERARMEFDLVWQDAVRLKSEYVNIANRLQSELPELENGLPDNVARKIHPDLPKRMQNLKIWIEKQKERAGLERLDSRSVALKERIAGSQLTSTNGPNVITADLGTMLNELDRAYESYLTDFREATDNMGKLLVGGFVAQRLEEARKALARLSDLAQQAQRDGKAIELFLETQLQSDMAKRTRRQEEVIRAFLEAGSPAEFARRIRVESGGAGDSSRSASPLKVSSLRKVRYGLWLALVGLGAFLIVDLYWRTVVMPLRLKLIQGDTIIKQQEQLAHFEQLAAGLAHEIRNPLTTINARLYTVQRTLQEGTPEKKDAMVIGSELDRVNQILKDFTLLTRPSPPKLALMTAEPLLKEVRDLMAPQLRQQGVRLECQSQGMAHFYGDQQQLKQVLINLVRNAAESIVHDGVILLRARDANVPLKGTQSNVAIIEVEDDGPGIPPEVQGRLFEPFFSTRKDGTGLGLPISARIIDRHGGTLDFETQPGRGTVFRITVPAREER